MDTNPVGSPPLAMIRLHNVLADMDRETAIQVANIRTAQEHVRRIFADGRLDYRDEPDMRALALCVEQEAQLNHDQKSRVFWSRDFCAKVAELVKTYRGKIQELKTRTQEMRRAAV